MIERVIQIAEAAGRVIEDVRRVGFDVTHKGSQGPVTEADHAADALLRQELLALEPCGWLSEETADDRSRLGHDRLWVVDPLDGTKEFIAGLPEYSVAVALVERHRPVLGVVHNPATGEVFWAVRGEGAHATDQVISVHEGKGLLASRSEVDCGEFAPFEREWDVTPGGSIEYKLALVAAGRVAATWSRGPKWEWDVCAGALLVEEAGGIATDAVGGPLRYNQTHPKVRGILAGAPDAYRRALQSVLAAGMSDRMDEFVEFRRRKE